MFAQPEVSMLLLDSWEKGSNKYNEEKPNIPSNNLNGVWDIEKWWKGGNHIDGK